ncbi:hypothetical protein D918_09954 [Trichuris suis]|nr:hypothetical protein D918_09954 [Trichuris suis]
MTAFGSGFGFGASAGKPASTFSAGSRLFGQAAPGTTAFSFGAPSQSSSFGQPTVTAKQSLTGSGLFNVGSIATTAPTFSPSSGFGQVAKPALVDAISDLSTSEDMLRYIVALTNPQLYGDERDAIIAKLNQLLAFLGCGKAYYANSAAPIEFTPKNPFCRLRFVGYNKRTDYRNEEGFVTLIIKRKAEEVRYSRQLLGDCIYRILGCRPSLAVNVGSVKPLPGDRQ